MADFKTENETTGYISILSLVNYNKLHDIVAWAATDPAAKRRMGGGGNNKLRCSSSRYIRLFALFNGVIFLQHGLPNCGVKLIHFQ